MAAREFSKLSPAIWSSKRFRALSDGARLSMLYLLTSAHIDSSGCYALPEGYACSDTGLDPETWRAHLSELVQGDLILADSVSEWVMVRRWFRHNPPMNRDHATGTRRRIAAIECDRLREACEAEFVEVETAMLARLEAKELEKAARKVPSHQMRDLIKDTSSALTRTGYMTRGNGG